MHTEVLGCTDAYAPNYNPYATTDDGSCEEGPSGCSDYMACNYYCIENDCTGVMSWGLTVQVEITPGTSYDGIYYPGYPIQDDGSCDYSCIG